MRRYIGALLATVLVFIPYAPTRADDQEARAILDKAINALGGEEKLGKATAFSWKSKGTVTINGEDRDANTHVTVKGIDHYRREFGNDDFNGVFVVAGDKGWRRFGDDSTELEGDALANQKRALYLHVIPTTLVALKGNGFKYEKAAEEKVGDKPAVVLKVTAPDGKDFRLFFDKETGLPVKEVATIVDFRGQERTEETTFADYKEFDGIKKATKVEIKRDGEKFQNMELTEFKVLDKVDPETFTEPK